MATFACLLDAVGKGPASTAVLVGRLGGEELTVTVDAANRMLCSLGVLQERGGAWMLGIGAEPAHERLGEISAMPLIEALRRSGRVSWAAW